MRSNAITQTLRAGAKSGVQPRRSSGEPSKPDVPERLRRKWSVLAGLGLLGLSVALAALDYRIASSRANVVMDLTVTHADHARPIETGFVSVVGTHDLHVRLSAPLDNS